MSDQSHQNAPRKLSRRQALCGLAGAAGSALAAPAWGAPTANAGPRPNIVFVMTDDQAWNAFGAAGRFPFLQTPNMDRLAREGAAFDNAFVVTSLCSPSRASFMTGCYPSVHGVRENEQRDPVDEVPLFPEVLRDNGYETAFIGKWHMRPSAEPRRGFDYWLSFRGQGTYFDPELNENGREFQARGYMTDILTDYAEQWLLRPHEDPFCMFLWHKAVHGPFKPAPRHEDAFPDARLPKPASWEDDLADKPAWMRRAMKYGPFREEWEASEGRPVPESLKPHAWDPANEGRLNYLRALLAVDDSLGRVLDTLEDLGQLDNTLVLFTSDNGFFLGEHRRGDKRLMYEESIRIPLLARYPRLIEPGTRVEEMALNIDAAPTCLELAGAPVPDTVQGRSLLPLFKRETPEWRDAFLYAYFEEGWLPGIPSIAGVRTERWKYVTYPTLPGVTELYDLRNDPHEMHNLAGNENYAGTEERLAKRLEELKEEYGYELEWRPPPIEVPLALGVRLTFEEVTGARVSNSGNGPEAGELVKAQVVQSGRGKAFRAEGDGYVTFPRGPESFTPARKPLTVGAWCLPFAPEGVVCSFGGQSQGFSLYLEKGRPCFASVVGGDKSVAVGLDALPMRAWSHVVGVLTSEARLQVFINGEQAGEAPAADFIASKPNEGFVVGADPATPAGLYGEGAGWNGLLTDVRLYWGVADEETLAGWR